uniref:Protein transport protein SEC61 gamma subunit n=1 Tax=Arundo donax TaxID=35708 RepID=A0A0A9EJK7_ARUDO
MTTNPIAVRAATLVNSLRSGLWQRLTRRTLSLANSRRGSTTESIASMAAW